MDENGLERKMSFLLDQQASLTAKLDQLHEEVKLLVRVSVRHDEKQKNISDLQDAQQDIVLRLLELQRENERRFEENERRSQENEHRFQENDRRMAKLDQFIEITQQQIQILVNSLRIRENGSHS